MDPVDLEALVDRKLKQLPVPRAPESLLPRVLRAVGDRNDRPWYARAWLTWPAGWQAASIAALVLLVTGVAWALPDALAVASGVASRLAAGTGELPRIVERVEATAIAGRVLWRVLVQPIAPYVLIVVLLMCLACVAFGTMLNRVAFGRA
jgi:hypothetical protein